MAPVISTTVVKDGNGTDIVGGVTTLEKTGDGTTGPFSFINALVDFSTGTTMASIKKASTTAVAGDTALVVGLHPQSNAVVVSSGTVTAVISGTATLNQAGAALSSTNGIFANLLLNGTTISTSNALPVQLTTTNLNPNGQTTMANSAPVVIASDQSAVSVQPPLTGSTTATPTLSTTTAYTATQVIGGLITFTSVLGTTTRGVVQSITCKFNTALHTVGLSVALFKAAATAGTYTDHVAIAINTADVTNLIGSYRLLTALSDVGNAAVYNLDGIGKAFQGGTSNLYGVVTALGTTLALGNVTTFSIELAVLPG